MNILKFILLIIMAFLPPILYAIWIRNTEKYNREKWRPIILCFIWGASIAVIAALFLEMALEVSLAASIEDPYSIGFLMVVLVAPFAEEFTKPLALRIKTVKKELDEPEDGLIYGAVAGLGFSATENLLYGWIFLSQGLMFFVFFMLLRSFGGCLLHASATAWTGFGIGKTVIKRISIVNAIPFFLLAISVHALYNFILSFEMIGAAFGLFAALSLAGFTIIRVRKKIIFLDSMPS